MINISIDDFKNNFDYYSNKVNDEDILLFDDNGPVMKITSPNKKRLETARSLMGCVNCPEINVDTIMENKLKDL